jgi:hypothetical protein
MSPHTKPSSRAKLIGGLLICCGIAPYGTWMLWLTTRTNVPVNMPISMSIGRVQTPFFKLNRDAPYDIEIEVQKKIPFDVLNCLLGTAMAPTSTELTECPNQPSVVKIAWVLESEGQIVSTGSTDTYRRGAWGNYSVARELGYFQGKKGQRYVLNLEVLTDGTALLPGNPRLKVGVDPSVYEGDLVGNAILLLVMLLFGLTGSIVLLISFFRNRGNRSPS